jgi:predicted Zn finger-like uncharacterized protein
MNVRCPQCATAFRVDPEKVPESGVRARCARCSAVFGLTRSGLAGAPKAAVAAAPVGAAAPPSAAPTAPARPAAPPFPTPAPQRPAVPPAAQRPAMPSGPPAAAQPPRAEPPRPAAPAQPPPVAPAAGAPAPGPRPIPPLRPAATPAPAAAPAAAGAPAKRPSFTKQDPQTRAQRLARALVSDIVAYNKEKRDQTLTAGTMKNEFREEIRKSWEEYVAQVGLDVARGTTFFRDALNEILAKGEQIF